MTRHPDAEVLARYREGLLGRRRSARIRAHLAGCQHCASLEAGLAEVTALLASAPAPVMPDELTARLQSALAAEAAARAQAQSPGAAAPDSGIAAGTGRRPRGLRGPVRPGRPGRPRQWRTAALGAAAVIAVLAAVGGAYGLARLVPQASSGSAGSSVAGPQVAPAPSPHALGPNQAQGSARQQMLALPAGRVPVISSGTDYLPGRLADQADGVLARYAAGAANQAPAAQAARLGTASTAKLRGCVALVTAGVLPRLVDVARYRGEPAVIIVQAPAGGRPGQVWAVGPGCSGGDSDLLARARLAGG